MLNIGDIVTVRRLEDIPALDSYTSSNPSSYYAISRTTLLDMSEPGNLYRIRAKEAPAPDFDRATEPVAYRLEPYSCEVMRKDGHDRRLLWFLENMLEPYQEEEIEMPDGDLTEFLFGGITE